MPFEVRLISAAETYDIRWPVLRAGLPRESAIFDGDDASEARHFGAFRDENLVGVTSIFPRPFPDHPERKNTWQLRGMAVVPEVQSQGAGEALLKAAQIDARQNGAECLWANARVPAARFYEKHGWTIIGSEFDIPTAGPHVRMWIAV